MEDAQEDLFQGLGIGQVGENTRKGYLIKKGKVNTFSHRKRWFVAELGKNVQYFKVCCGVVCVVVCIGAHASVHKFICGAQTGCWAFV